MADLTAASLADTFEADAYLHSPFSPEERRLILTALRASIASEAAQEEITSAMEEAGMAVAKHDLGFGVTRAFAARVYKAMRKASVVSYVKPINDA